MGLRLCLGLVSDICNHCADFVTPKETQVIIPALRNILQGENFEISAKLRAIIAIGDLALVSE
jgi:hypothetical protein